MKPTIHELFERAAKRAGLRLRQVGALTLLEEGASVTHERPAVARPRKVRKPAGRNGRAASKADR